MSFRLVRILLLALPAAAPLHGQDIRQQIADQVDQASYRNVLDNELYTRWYHNRGRQGAHHDPARDAIAARFASFGLAVELDPFVLAWDTWENVVATHVGVVDPDVMIIIGAHYDSANNPGADDDASGVAGLLEIARVLSQYDTAYSIRFIAFDMEEEYLRGSTHYVATYGVDGVAAMIQLDMIAWNNGLNRCRIHGRTKADWLKLAFADAASNYAAIDPIVDGRADNSDHAAFASAGVPAILVIEDSYSSNPCYHRACDSVSTGSYIDYPFATEITRATAAVVAELAGAGVVACPGDLTRDGLVDFSDFAALSACWAAPCGDLDGDAVTEFADFAILSSNWGCDAFAPLGER